MKNYTITPRALTKQKGAVLAVGMIMLLLLTLVGISGSQVTSLEEKMAGNSRDQNLAFQAAENALRIGENWVQLQSSKPLATGSPNTTEVWSLNGLGNTTEWWEENNSQLLTTNAIANDLVINGVTTKQQYVIEQQSYNKDSLNVGMASDNSGRAIYRVTAKGTGGYDQTKVILQTSYSRRF